MVRIRLRRVGGKKQPSYRVVVADQRTARDGRFIETVGNYNPRVDPPHVYLEEERVLYWLSQGAQPSEAVSRMLRQTGIWDRHLGLGETDAQPEADSEKQPEPEVVAQPESAVDEDTVKASSPPPVVEETGTEG
jgi:small subunit ribosomal protein S16